MLKVFLYLLTFPFTMWSVESLKIEHLFKKNSTIQIQLFYLLLSICITYLVANFFYDFFIITQSI